MAGSPTYTDEEIRFVLDCILRKKKHDETAISFQAKFQKPLRPNQIRYLKNKYGRSHHFGCVFHWLALLCHFLSLHSSLIHFTWLGQMDVFSHFHGFSLTKILDPFEYL